MSLLLLLDAAAQAQTYSQTGSRGFVLGGAAAAADKMVIIPSGGFVLGGAAAISTQRGNAIVGSGGFVLGGSGIITRKKVIAPSGGFLLGGAAAVTSLLVSILEPIYWFLQDDAKNPITGAAAATTIKILRGADDAMLDWADGFFKKSGWASTISSFTEIDATNLPGEYKKVLNIAGWQDDRYQIIARYVGAVTRNGHDEILIQGGRVVDRVIAKNLDAAVSSRLAASGYTAPDNMGIAAIKAKTDALNWADITLLISLIKNKKELKKLGTTWYLIIYDNATPKPNQILNKALKDPSGADITDLQAGAMAQEMASSV